MQRNGMQMQCTGTCWHKRAASASIQIVDFRTVRTLHGMHWHWQSLSCALGWVQISSVLLGRLQAVRMVQVARTVLRNLNLFSVVLWTAIASLRSL